MTVGVSEDERNAGIARRVIEHFGAIGPRVIRTKALTLDCWQAFEPGGEGEAILIQYARETNELRINVGTDAGILCAYDMYQRPYIASWGAASETITETLDAINGIGPDLTDDDRHCLNVIAALTAETGRAPSAWQVKRRMQSRSSSTIAYHIDRLARAGCIAGGRRNLNRPIRLLAALDIGPQR